jgi:transcriptional regulator with XRE-family HTH domain
LRRERLRRALTQNDLAKLAGISYVTLSRLENGAIATPTPTTLRKLATALGIEPELLIEWGDDVGKATPLAA